MAVRVTQVVLTALIAKPSISPATPGAGNVAITQAVLTAIMLPLSSVRVSQAVLTALLIPGDAKDTPGAGGTPSGAATHTYGYAV